MLCVKLDLSRAEYQLWADFESDLPFPRGQPSLRAAYNVRFPCANALTLGVVAFDGALSNALCPAPYGSSTATVALSWALEARLVCLSTALRNGELLWCSVGRVLTLLISMFFFIAGRKFISATF